MKSPDLKNEQMGLIKSFARNKAKRLISIYETKDDKSFSDAYDDECQRRDTFDDFVEEILWACDFEFKQQIRGLWHFFRVKITNHYLKSGKLMTLGQIKTDGIENYELNSSCDDFLCQAIQKRRMDLYR